MVQSGLPHFYPFRMEVFQANEHASLQIGIFSTNVQTQAWIVYEVVKFL